MTKTLKLAALILLLSVVTIAVVLFNEYQRESAVRKVLIDPDSARFGAHFVNGNYACVEVNARNQMGGYAGRSWIIVHKTSDGWTALNKSEYCEDVIERLAKNAD